MSQGQQHALDSAPVRLAHSEQVERKLSFVVIPASLAVDVRLEIPKVVPERRWDRFDIDTDCCLKFLRRP